MELITIPTEHKDHFKTIDTRILENPKLSSVAVKFHCYAISRPPNWDLKWANLLHVFKEGEDALKKGIRELVTVGYLLKMRRREAGKFIWVYVVFERPAAPDVMEEHRKTLLKMGLEVPKQVKYAKPTLAQEKTSVCGECIFGPYKR